MKVALIHFRIAKAGGLETRLANYVAYFLKNGDEVTIIHARHDEGIKLHPNIIQSKIPVRFIPKPLRMWRFGAESRRILKQLHFDFSLSLGRTPGQDVLICPGTHIGFLRSLKKKIYSPFDFLNIELDRKAFQESKIVLAASEMIRREILEFYRMPDEKIKTLHPPSDPGVFNFSNRKIRVQLQEKFGIDSGKRNFLFVSSGHSRKGLQLLLNIFQRLIAYPVHLFIAGSSVKSALPANVSYLGFVEEMPELYAAADALIHPALYEPFGQVVSESLMCGTPVIISSKTGAAELIHKNEGMVISSFEVERWVEAIHQFLQKEWNVPENFSERNGLTIDSHMDKMLRFLVEIK